MITTKCTVQLCVLGLLAATFGAPCAESEMSVDTILQLNLKAVRGNSEIGRIQTTDMTLSISEADYSLIARYRAADDGVMRIDVFADGQRVFSEGKDGLGVWEWPGGQDAPKDVTHEGAAALEHGVEFNLFPLAELIGRGHSIDLVGREEIRGNHYFVLVITLSDGFETYRYINEETWLVEISRDYRALHPGNDATKKSMETRYDQFRRTDGILSAGRSRDFEQSSDQAIQTMLVLDAKYNVPRAGLDLDRSYVPDGPPRVQ